MDRPLSTLRSVWNICCNLKRVREHSCVKLCWLRPLTLRAWLRRQLKARWTMSCRWSRRCRYLLKLLTSPLLLPAAPSGPLNGAEDRSVTWESFCHSFAMKRYGLLMIYAVFSRVCLKNVFFHVGALCVGKSLATGWDESLLLWKSIFQVYSFHASPS